MPLLNEDFRAKQKQEEDANQLAVMATALAHGYLAGGRSDALMDTQRTARTCVDLAMIIIAEAKARYASVTGAPRA